MENFEIKKDWRLKNGWGIYCEDEEYGITLIYECENGSFHWTEKEIKGDTLQEIKKYKAWYDELITTEDIRKLFQNREFFDFD